MQMTTALSTKLRALGLRTQLSLGLGAALLVACETGVGEDTDLAESNMDTVGRRVFGVGAEYPASPRDPTELATELASSMQERRRFGWSVAERAIRKVAVPSFNGEVPAFMTWYTSTEIGTFFQGFLQKLPAARRDEIRADLAAGRKPTLTETETRAAMEQAAASSPVNMTEDEFAALLRHVAAEGAAGQAGAGMQHEGFTGLSTSFVRHIFQNFGAVATCDFNTAPPNLDLLSEPSFSHCIPEFPKDAVMIKTAWRSATGTMANFDTSADGFTKAWANSVFAKVAGAEEVPMPGPDEIYRIKDRTGAEWALTAIHLVTKETREWVWTSLSWSTSPDADLGQDRPASIPAPFNHYKLTVTTAFLEGDPSPWIGADGKEIPALRTLNGLKKASEPTLTTWASDPHVETTDPRSNCIGCHGGAFGQNVQTRKNFPSDFSFSVFNMSFPLNQALRLENLAPPPSSTDAGAAIPNVPGATSYH